MLGPFAARLPKLMPSVIRLSTGQCLFWLTRQDTNEFTVLLAKRIALLERVGYRINPGVLVCTRLVGGTAS